LNEPIGELPVIQKEKAKDGHNSTVQGALAAE